MKKLNFKHVILVYIAIFTISCENEALETESNNLSEKELNVFVTDYGLKDMETIKINNQSFLIKDLSKTNQELILNAFENYPVIIYSDDDKQVELFSKDMSLDDFHERVRNKNFKEENNSIENAKVPTEKVYYNVEMYEAKDFGGQKISRNGTMVLARDQTKNVTVNNVGSAFNDKMSSVGLYVEPYNSKKCSVRATLSLYKDHFLGSFMSHLGGYTDYGVARRSRYSYVSGSVSNMKSFDKTVAVFELYWYTYYKTVSLNDQLTSFQLSIKREL